MHFQIYRFVSVLQLTVRAWRTRTGYGVHHEVPTPSLEPGTCLLLSHNHRKEWDACQSFSPWPPSGFLLLLSQATTNLVAETAQIHSLTVLVSNQAGSVSLGGLQSVDGLSVSLLDINGRNCLLVFSSSLNSPTFLGPWPFFFFF